jgi:hypothetical protein
MTLLRLLNVQGIAGIVASLALAILLGIQKGETRHWKKQSGQYEQLYAGERAAFAGTVANYRAAAEAARAADKAAAEQVAAEQRAINERTSHDYEARIADARAAAERLRKSTEAAADPRSRRAAPVPGLSAAPGEPRQAAGQNGLSVDAQDLDWRLTATEQAIQLDELIKWVKRQATIDPNRGSSADPQ